MNKSELERLRKIIRNIEKRDNRNEPKVKYVPASTIPGKEINNSAGSFFLIENEYPLSHEHGNIKLGDLKKIPKKFLALIGKDERFNDIYLNEIAFIDTESTGISGAGTYLFLIGIGYFTEDKYILRQYFMRDFNEEEAMLFDLDTFLDNFAAFISFNGKTFDIPNIETRLILSRIMKDIKGVPHLDLLHPARRLWKRMYDSFNLTSLERNLLSLHRVDDVPSELIPEIYFNYVRTKNPSRIKKVIEHNTYDIISMVGVLLKEVSVISDFENLPANILFNVGRFYENIDKVNTALNIYTKIFENRNNCKKEFYIKGSCRLAYLLKKMNLKDESTEVWEKLVEYIDELGPEPYLELAKFYEHHKKNNIKALEIINCGLELCKENRIYRDYLEDFKNRFERLSSKNKN